jgi:hypothetical protein
MGRDDQRQFLIWMHLTSEVQELKHLRRIVLFLRAKNVAPEYIDFP